MLPNQDMQYAYDAAGNRTQTIVNGVTTTYTVNDLNEYTQVGGTAYTYDEDGNLLTKTDGGVTTNYTFDDLNRLVGVDVAGRHVRLRVRRRSASSPRPRTTGRRPST